MFVSIQTPERRDRDMEANVLSLFLPPRWRGRSFSSPEFSTDVPGMCNCLFYSQLLHCSFKRRQCFIGSKHVIRESAQTPLEKRKTLHFVSGCCRRKVTNCVKFWPWQTRSYSGFLDIWLKFSLPVAAAFEASEREGKYVNVGLASVQVTPSLQVTFLS